MTLWFQIAKNEIRKKTYRFRKHRRLFLITLYAIFLFWAVYIGPTLFDLIIPELIKSFSAYFLTIISQVIEYSFMILFLIFILYPLFLLYRKLEIEMKDVILASPAKPGDIFLGEFLGQLPFFLLFILGVGPLVVSLLIQINPNMTIFHYLSFYLIFFSLIVLCLLIGYILANWLEHKFLLKKKSSLLKNLFFLILPFIVILMMYIFHWIFDIVNNNKQLKPWMSLFPSFWYSDIILYLINPLLTYQNFLTIWIEIVLIISIPLILIYISYKKADVFYDLDYSTKEYAVKVNYKGKLSSLIKWMTLSKYKVLVVTQFKEFIRKKENLNRLLYLIAINALFGVFILLSLKNPLLLTENFTFTDSSLFIQVLQFSYTVMLILSWVGGLTFGIFMGIYIFIDSKGILFVYKKSTRNVKALIVSFLYEMIYIIIFLDIILTIFFLFIFKLDFLNAIVFFATFIINSIIILSQAVGIQCIRPLFEEKGKFIYFNIYLIALIQIISFLISLLILIPIIPSSMNYGIGLIFVFLVYFGVSLGLAVILLTYGAKKLVKIE